MGVDVLAELREVYGRHSNKTIDAVAELIEAGSSLQAAMDEDDSNKFDIAPAQRFFAADARHRAALAKATGATDGR